MRWNEIHATSAEECTQTAAQFQQSRMRPITYYGFLSVGDVRRTETRGMQGSCLSGS